MIFTILGTVLQAALKKLLVDNEGKLSYWHFYQRRFKPYFLPDQAVKRKIKFFISSYLISQQRLPKLTLRLRQQRLEFVISAKGRDIAAKKSKITAYEN
jgi:hypothetical protein